MLCWALLCSALLCSALLCCALLCSAKWLLIRMTQFSRYFESTQNRQKHEKAQNKKRGNENYKPSTPQGVVFAIRYAMFYKPCWQNKTYQLSWDSSVLLSSVQFCCSITCKNAYMASPRPNTKSKKSSKQANTQAKYKPSPLSRCGFCNKICNFPQTLWGPTLAVQLRKLSDMHF